MTKILYIHGANSTARSFNYMKDKLPQHEQVFFEYSTSLRVVDNIARAQALCDEENPHAIIGHSLGGIIACHLTTQAMRVALASPFGGSLTANFFPMMSQLMRDVATTSPVVSYFRRHPIEGPTMIIVAYGLDGRGFDGVLSSTSQMRINGKRVEFHHYDLNHYEVMVDPEICEKIARFIGLS